MAHDKQRPDFEAYMKASLENITASLALPFEQLAEDFRAIEFSLTRERLAPFYRSESVELIDPTIKHEA